MYTVAEARGRLARLHRTRPKPDAATIADYKRDLELAKLERSIAQFLAATTPTDEQRARLVKLLGGAA